MSELTRLVCAGCGAEPPAEAVLPFRCPNAGSDDVDHVLRREPIAVPDDWRAIFLDSEKNPFVRYRRLFHSYTAAIRGGMTDLQYVALVHHLNVAVHGVDGVGFVETPFGLDGALSGALERSIRVKDETGNVSGSHKARHLFGILLWIEVMRQTGRLADAPLSLAIASCGNAALGAAVVARAAKLPLDVFVPTDAHPRVVERLRRLGAMVHVCPRDESIPGDPCIHRFRERIAQGAIPFGVQGNENGLALEGGMTLGYEMVSQLLREEATLDRIFIQVGGGALASSCIQALQDAIALGLLPRLPVIHAVQTEGAHPLERAWEQILPHVARSGRAGAIRYAAQHRSEFMWAWESVPHSIAHGILDDETYDWLAIVDGMLASGGSPVVVSEEELADANRIARVTTNIPADPTGTSGLAGCVHLLRSGSIPTGETLAVLFTGRER